MKILYVVPYAPNLIRTRPYSLIRAMTRRGHEVSLVTLWEHEDELPALRRLEQEGVRVVAFRLSRGRVGSNLVGGLASGKPLQAAYSWHPDLAREVGRRLSGDGRPDVIHIEHLRGSVYGLKILSLARRMASSSAIVWDSVDCISMLFERAARHSRSRSRRWIARLELPRTRRWEGMLVRKFPRVLASSREDALALERLAASGDGLDSPEVSVLPNGVDLEYFHPNGTAREPDTLVLTGKMSYHANLTAALHLIEDIMPRVWAKRPGVKVVLAGKSPPPEVRALSERHAGHVVVTGTVSDLRPYLWKASVAVVPVVYGAGSQFKVFEAMASGTPVVASTQAGSALTAHTGHDWMVAEDPSSFAEAILHLLDDGALRQALSENGRTYVEKHHDWAAIAASLEDIYLEDLEKSLPPAAAAPAYRS